MRASHILVKNKNSRRAASWRDPDGKVIQKRTEEEVRSQPVLTVYGHNIILKTPGAQQCR
jgi:hypothetical protein